MQATATRRRSTKDPLSASARQTATLLGALLHHLFAYDRGAQLRAMESTGLSLTQLKTLFLLADEERLPGPCPGKQLAERLGISMPSVSRAVDGLVAKGFVSRVEDPDDRRVRRIAITKSGRRTAEEIASARLSGLRQFVAELSVPQRRRLDSVLRELLDRDEIAASYAQLKKVASR